MRNYNNQTQNKKHLACLINFHKKIVIKFLCLAILASHTQNALANDTPNPADNTFLGKLFVKRLPVDDEAKFKIGINVGQVKDGYRTKTTCPFYPTLFLTITAGMWKAQKRDIIHTRTKRTIFGWDWLMTDKVLTPVPPPTPPWHWLKTEIFRCLPTQVLWKSPP